MGAWKTCRYVLLTLSFVLFIPGCHGRYEVTVVNRMSTPVVVYVDGERWGSSDKPVQPCTQEILGTAPYYSTGQVIRVQVRDLKGLTILETEAMPRLEGGLYRAVVVVPSSIQEECEQMLVIPTPTAAALDLK